MQTLKQRLLFLACLTGIVLSSALFEQCTSKSGKESQIIPLIDRELFFDNPEIAGGQLSPDGQFMSFLKPYRDVMNVWVKKIAEPFDKAVPLTADTIRPIRGYFWSFDSKNILYTQDKGGNENFQVYAVDPTSAVDVKTGVPQSRNLTHKDGVRAYIYNVSKKNPDLLWIGLNDRDPAWHDLYQLKISSGELKLLHENKDRITGWDFDWDENLRLASRSSEKGATEILRVDKDKLIKIYECGPLETSYTVAFSEDNKKVYFVTNKGKENNFSHLEFLDPANGTEEFVESDPEKKVDFGGAQISDVTHKLIGTSYTDAKVRRYWKDSAFEADYKFLESKFPGLEIDVISNDAPETNFLVSVQSDVDPSSVYLFNRKTKELSFQYKPRPKLPSENLSPMQSISYPSSDSLVIPAYLTIPKGKEAKNLPLLVIPHGGPWARDVWGYNSYAQFFSNRGYAVLQMNFRGSTGYGKAFLNAGNRQWGDKMQDDISWGVKYLIAKGIADPKKVGILGGSYGGYATLAGVTFTPDLYAAAVAVVAPSNLITLLNSIPPYWEAGRITFHLRMGDPTNAEGKSQLERQSPLNSVTKIKTPLMVVQGANDPRVKKTEADQIVVAMRENKIPVVYLLAPDEGHGFARPVNNMAYLAASEKFLAEHLGGRFQESMKPEVAKRLGEITVDVNSVVKPNKK